MEDNNSLVIKAQHVYPESSRREIHQWLEFSFNAQSMTYHTYTQFNIDWRTARVFSWTLRLTFATTLQRLSRNAENTHIKIGDLLQPRSNDTYEKIQLLNGVGVKPAKAHITVNGFCPVSKQHSHPLAFSFFSKPAHNWLF